MQTSPNSWRRTFVNWGLKQFTDADSAYRQAIIDLTEPDSSALVVDCGCGDGASTLNMTSRIQPYEIWGIEADPDEARGAERRGIRVSLSDLNAPFPYDSDVADVVLSNQVIEHLKDTDLFMAEIWRILKPGGYAIICTENLASWHNIFSLLLGWQPFSLTNISSKARNVGNPLALHRGDDAPVVWMQHLRVMAHHGLVHLSAVHGFTIDAVRGAGYYPLPQRLSTRMARLDPRHAAFLALKLRKPLS